MKKYPAMASSSSPAVTHGLYIDLNGLIHPCCHSDEDASVVQRSESEKLQCICREVEVLVATVRPRELIYIATDGVAPRAKMNQQRARRYMGRAKATNPSVAIVEEVVQEFEPHEMAQVDDELDGVRQSLLQDALYGGVTLGEERSPAEEVAGAAVVGDVTLDVNNDMIHINNSENDGGKNDIFAAMEGLVEDTVKAEDFDSNCISPGTAFMAKVAASVLEMVQERLAGDDPLWTRTRVVVSSAQTPGEGEHKIIDFLRTQSSYPGFNGKGAHVIAGLDADLIFLALSLHIPHVFILRDKKRNPYNAKSGKEKRQRWKKGAGDTRDTQTDEGGDDEVEDGEFGVIDDSESTRSNNKNGRAAAAAAIKPNKSYEYFEIDTVGSCLMSELNGLCQMKGFSPASEEAFSPELLVSANGYHFCRHAGCADGALRSLFSDERKHQQQHQSSDWRKFRPCASNANSKVIDDVIVLAMLMGNDFLPRLPSVFCGESALDNLLELYVTEVLPYGFLTAGNHEINLPQLRRLLQSYAKIEAVHFRRFQLSQEAMTLQETAAPLSSAVDERWRKPYLASTGLASHIDEACAKYVEGLRFVWRYYSGNSATCSWSWYYPFHHAPFAADLATFLQNCDLARLPPPPLETTPPDTLVQLLCILPPTSHALLPPVVGNVMLAPPDELRETFPTTWRIDYTSAFGKEYLAAVMLPFANVARLHQLVEAVRQQLTEEEGQRLEQLDYHLVLSSQTTTFNLHGDESELSAKDAALWGVQHEGVTCVRLRDSPPERGRPKTYSSTVAIPWVTCDTTGNPYRRERRSHRKRREEVEGAKTNSGVTLINKGPSLAAYFAGLAAASVLTALAVLPWTMLHPLQVLAVNLVGIALTFVIGIAVHDPVNGSGIRRNNIPMTYVDWLCADCLCLNFALRDKCFVCRAPFDEHRCLAVFSNTRTATPPVYDPDHTPYIETVGLVLDRTEADTEI
ncbi:putative 5-3 exonuclease XRNB, putative,exoribonuclease 2 [Trypanosoma grayi]|uniref:putative 5-3 exonuclease XRNB, putative,exoribonuclease 2 n=1 Tax=Trypanosoma grayi TaxID=71804 RepID=UPI0004F42A97|nr:putative 5-3 exonuclease XRNB, putative,exoribonuclease 2 [Trypanosoma grayi]KEG08463.1 putative 5-3 exonuclease XRNB, putative,exoribonuclease 2 [Trypanosoma grayi]